MAYYEGDYPFGNNGGGMGFGGEWGGLIGLLIVASLFGNGGFGIGGGGRGQAATQADLAAGFANNSILSNLNDILLSQSQGFAGVQQTLCQGFSGLNLGVERGFAQTNFNMQQCCCGIERAIDGVNFNNANNTAAIIQAINCGNQKIIDYMQNEKIDTLNRKLAVAEGQISQANQTATLLNAINRTPIPAYTVPNPYCCYQQSCGCGNNFGGFGGFTVQ